MKFFAQDWFGFRQLPDRCHIGAVHPKIGSGDLLLSPTMDLEVLRRAPTSFKASHGFCLIDRILSHLAISRPFPSPNGETPNVFLIVVARQSFLDLLINPPEFGSFINYPLRVKKLRLYNLFPQKIWLDQSPCSPANGPICR